LLLSVFAGSAFGACCVSVLPSSALSYLTVCVASLIVSQTDEAAKRLDAYQQTLSQLRAVVPGAKNAKAAAELRAARAKLAESR
jgi:hypothetical protein